MEYGRADEAGQTELVWTPDMVRLFWEHVRKHPEQYFSFQVGSVIARRFRKYLSGRVVDYGAGPGFLVKELLRSGVRCGAVEFGDDAVSRLEAQFGGHKDFLGARDRSRLGDWANTIDAVLLIEVVEHLYDEQLNDSLLAIRSLLKPGGCLIVTTPNEEDRSKSFICSPESGKLFHRYQHVRSWTAESLTQALTKRGFEVAVVGTTNFSADLVVGRGSIPWVIRFVRSAVQKMKRQTPNLYAIAFSPKAPASRLTT